MCKQLLCRELFISKWFSSLRLSSSQSAMSLTDSGHLRFSIKSWLKNNFNVQTTTTRKTVNISLTEFPLYFSLLSEPGYDLRKLKSFGFPSEAEFFIGRTDNENYTKALSWSNSNASIQSTIFNLQINIRSKTNLCRDLWWKQGK